MTVADRLNLAGFLIASSGSILGMAGALKQANAYYPFKAWPLAGHALKVTVRSIFRKNVLEEIKTAAKLAEVNSEDRVKSLQGLYWLFCGFLLQLAGSAVLLLASLLAASH
jgi:hypothetical protein